MQGGIAYNAQRMLAILRSRSKKTLHAVFFLLFSLDTLSGSCFSFSVVVLTTYFSMTKSLQTFPGLLQKIKIW